MIYFLNYLMLSMPSHVNYHDCLMASFQINGIRWHQCTYCTKEFKKPSDLVRHIRIHTHEKPYKCNQCFRSFAVKSTLTAHERTHMGIKDYKCTLCDKLFTTNGSLRVHMRLHTGARPFQREHCDKKFRTSGHCKTHMQAHYRGSGEGGDRKPRRAARRTAKKPDLNLPDVQLQEPILITDTGIANKSPSLSYLLVFPSNSLPNSFSPPTSLLPLLSSSPPLLSFPSLLSPCLSSQLFPPTSLLSSLLQCTYITEEKHHKYILNLLVSL